MISGFSNVEIPRDRRRFPPYDVYPQAIKACLLAPQAPGPGVSLCPDILGKGAIPDFSPGNENGTPAAAKCCRFLMLYGIFLSGLIAPVILPL